MVVALPERVSGRDGPTAARPPADKVELMTANPAHTALWPAPYASGAVDATVHVPGSKSVTNRALVLAALSDGPSVIANPLRARDTALATGALRALGSEITEYQTGWRVTPGHPAPGSAVSVDLGNAGTVMRFVPGLAALTSATVTFDGDERIRLRPIGPILAALRLLGASIDDGGRGAAPLVRQRSACGGAGLRAGHGPRRRLARRRDCRRPVPGPVRRAAPDIA